MGQGYALDADLRRAIEQYAMEIAKAFYEKQGWSVFDVSATHSYDLLCTSATGKELHVEVKGTTSEALKQMVDQFIHHPTNHPGQDVADVVATFQFGWRPFAHC